jgi:D-threo-aldose 1-dehydrogenase
VIDEALPELARSKREGLVGKVGIAVSDWRVCVDILRETALDCLLLAGRYTLLDQSGLAELLPLCEKRGVRLAIGGAFNSGILATGVKAATPLRFNYEPAPAAMVERARRLEAICERFDVPLRAAALQFPLAHPNVDTVLVGVKTLAHWRDAVEKLAYPIPSALWDALRSAHLIDERAPTP